MSSSSAKSKMALFVTVLSTVGSIAATTMFVHSIIHDYIPRELHEYLFFGLRNMFTKFSNQLTMVIDEFNGLVNNEIYEAAETYFGNNLSPNIHQLKISKPEKEKNFNIAMERNEEPVNLNHLATFETFAMESDQKDMISKDLERFVKRKYYYRKVGNEWKRGYLLFGPPETEKSGLIVAMANYLNFDIYDLELTSLRGNMELQRLLVAIANKSILVVEDIDCTIDLQDNLANRATVVHSINGFRMQENKAKRHHQMTSNPAVLLLPHTGAQPMKRTSFELAKPTKYPTPNPSDPPSPARIITKQHCCNQQLEPDTKQQPNDPPNPMKTDPMSSKLAKPLGGINFDS
ncbi:hypothetical protein MTR67_011494 [Solanum verrucosum]|uniref:AAA-type ATPase N-terminal domain-containing protein n=1 Tax=Solanum verrucosum TaxID=315347 RepID=A0AAF0QDV3_SOLVR|nr:hypothetical protein MTR67_011494 [Solanum verrucosum]